MWPVFMNCKLNFGHCFHKVNSISAQNKGPYFDNLALNQGQSHIPTQSLWVPVPRNRHDAKCFLQG